MDTNSNPAILAHEIQEARNTMQKNKKVFVEPLTTAPDSELDAAVQTVYRTFSRYRAPHGLLDVCIACCMDEALELEMRCMALRGLTQRHFYQYNDSAKSEVQPANEIKYYLPRMLELLVQGARLHHSTEIYLDRLGRCEPGSYSDKEQAALQAFALAYFAQGLEQGQAQGNLFQGENAFTILLMWDYAGVPLEPLLNHWFTCESHASTLHFVQACYWDYVRNTQQINNPFASNRPNYRQTLETWLTTAVNQARWVEKLMRLVDQSPATGWLPSGAYDHPHYPLDARISAVFDAMTNA